MGKFDSAERREHLAAALRLLDNDSQAIDISHLAKKFGVSRQPIYNDLQKLGIGR